MEVLNWMPYQAMCKYADGLRSGRIADQLRADPPAEMNWDKTKAS